MKTQLSNPYFKKISSQFDITEGKSASYRGIALKIVFFLMLTGAGVAAYMLHLVPEQYTVPALIATGTVALITPFINFLVPKATLVFGSLFCIAEGYLIGFLSESYSNLYHGIIPIALTVTFGVVFVMLALYATKIIKVGHKFKVVITTLFMTSILFSGIVFISSFFTPVLANFVWGNSWFGIGIAVVMLLIAALNLVVDFDNIALSVKKGYSSKYEWSLAFGVAMSIILIFIRILELVAKIMSKTQDN